MTDPHRLPQPSRGQDFRVVSGDFRCVLGEGPVWSSDGQHLLWVDILDPAVYRAKPLTGAIQRWPITEEIGWVIPRRNKQGYIAGLRSGFAALTLDPFSLQRLVAIPAHATNRRLRLNDGKADARGRIFAGTMDMDGREAGKLLRLDPDRGVCIVDDGYGITNGPAFSPDGKTLYHTDSRARRVFRFDVKEDGALTNKRVFIDFPEDWGVPDGMTTDREGYLWIAHWGGSRVSRFTPSADLVRAIHLPASQITSCAFGGPNFDRLYVTSAALDVVDEEFAGCVFEVDPGCTGLPPNSFAG